MIEFLCPNGHRIRCPAEQAGRAAKCPRCGVKFRVPEAADLTPAEVTGSDSGISSAELIDSGIADKKSPSTIVRTEREPPIEFLCPNGHRLFGAASLQGKAGKCPECGSRFRIPIREDSPIGNVSLQSGQFTEASQEPPSDRAAVSPAESLQRLWSAAPAGRAVEIHLRDGTKLSPERFLKNASGPDFAVFAAHEPDGTTTVTAVAWEAILRVVVGGLSELPPSLDK